MTKKLLWTEYCESCRLCNREPLMYSQFCHYIQQEEQKRRATMHIPRRPAEAVEVDRAGDPAHGIDPDMGELMDAHLFVATLPYSQYTYVEGLCKFLSVKSIIHEKGPSMAYKQKVEFPLPIFGFATN